MFDLSHAKYASTLLLSACTHHYKSCRLLDICSSFFFCDSYSIHLVERTGNNERFCLHKALKETKGITPVINVDHSSVTFLGRNAHEIIALQRAQKMPITERGELTFGQSCIEKLQLPCRLSQKPFFSLPPSSPLPNNFTHFTGIHKYSGMERDFVKGE